MRSKDPQRRKENEALLLNLSPVMIRDHRN
jgi:hypothetical protein